ncbi:ANTH domain-containing protein [Thamnocephalis sphaerospora]|uniref:ANTH domain-containing protein n=1 Tax=Thamnocephalis sphaerospora TaxID=78915 RepID=A0A4P9XVF6_9FUNG|nr:ANTH domain-containing protein [Thamnocephalis sphaerospora]|eukprot:RKP09390.1 ANTH domain-containing protein [Thamnocephalis sphaerospora]
MSFRSSSAGGLRPQPLVRTKDMERSLRKATRGQPLPAKQKHLDVLVAASWSHEVAMSDCIALLSQRMRDGNAMGILKTLIIVHVLMRDGSTDRVMGYLVTMPSLLSLEYMRDRSSSQTEHIRMYAAYLEEKVMVYRELKIDFVRAYAGTFARASDPRSRPRTSDGTQPPTIGRLRRLPVEKGLLKEVATVQRLIAALLRCQFFVDEVDNPVTLEAFRLLIRDLLRLFQAVNEGVINILEHYFEMEYEEAGKALDIYKTFTKQTESVVDYLEVARKMQYAVQINIPKMKHPPVSLVTALEDYLKSITPASSSRQYESEPLKRSQSATRPQQAAPSTQSVSRPVRAVTMAPALVSTMPTTHQPVRPSGGEIQRYTSPAPPANAPPEIMDFFASIEEEQRFLDDHPALVASAVANTGGNPFHDRLPIAYRPLNPFRQTLMITDGHTDVGGGMPAGATSTTGLNPFGQRPPSMFTPELNGLDLAIVPPATSGPSGGQAYAAVGDSAHNPFGQQHTMAANYSAGGMPAIYTAASSTSTSPDSTPWALTPASTGATSSTGNASSLNPFMFGSRPAAASTSWLPSTTAPPVTHTGGQFLSPYGAPAPAMSATTTGGSGHSGAFDPYSVGAQGAATEQRDMFGQTPFGSTFQ